MAKSHFRSYRLATAILGTALLSASCSESLPTEGRGSDPRPQLAVSGADIGTFDGTIRIGVVPSASTVLVGGTGNFVVKNRDSGEHLLSGTDEQVSVSMASNVVTRTSMRLQVACIFTAEPPTVLLTRAQSLGYVTHTVQITTSSGAKCWRVYLGDFPMGTSWSVREAFRQKAIADGLADRFAWWPSSGVTVTEGTVLYEVARAGETVTSAAPVVVEPLDGLVLIGGKPYRGTAEVAMNSIGSLAGINQLAMEAYLWGVVPEELPPAVYPELEALKAQAVAARTWALVGFRKRLADGYNLRATTDDQVYGGVESEHPLSTRAVDETAGVVATYNGQPISTYYSSTSGGHTAGFDEWLDNASPVSYLTGKLDAERGAAPENVPSMEVFRRAPISANLRAFHGGDYEADWSRYHRWSFQWTNEEISRLLSMTYGPVGKVLAIEVLERGPSGRVLKIRYVTERGPFTSTYNGIRSSLKFINAKGAAEGILSTLFYIEPVLAPATKELAGFKAYGGGWGHGVGMSQTGAVGRAEKGATYEEILKFYYTGIELEKRY